LSKLIYKITSLLALLFPVKLLIKLSGINTIYPFYHLVNNSPPAHIKYLYKTKSVSQFKKDIDFISKYFKPVISIPEKIYQSEEASFLLSFDDGLSECFDILRPVLKEKNINAVFFINSAFVGNNNLFYKYKASLLIEKIKKSELNDNLIKEIITLDKEFKILSNNDLINFLSKMTYKQSGILDKLADILEFNFEAYIQKNKLYMTAKEIEQLANEGHIIGSHGIDHPLFSDIDESEQLRQIKESTEYIQNRIATSIRLFAFPFTDHKLTLSLFKKIHNYKIVDYTFGTAGIKEDIVINNIQRIPIELHGLSAKRTIKAEYLLYILKRMIGKHIIRRK